MRPSHIKYTAGLLGLVSLLAVIVGCDLFGVNTFFGAKKQMNPTEPCEERVPTATPIPPSPTPTPLIPTEPARTPIPVVIITPTPPPEPSGECEGPGQVLICEGEVPPEVKITPLPEPEPPPKPSSSGVVLFAAASSSTKSLNNASNGNGVYNGNLGGRFGANGICEDYKPAGYSNSVAFISVPVPFGPSNADAIINIPFNYGVPTNLAIISKFGKLVADNWNDLVDGSIAQTLYEAGVLPSGAFWWSGSYWDGIIHPDTCDIWDSESDGDSGWIGSANSTDTEWMDFTDKECDELIYLLCLAYNQVSGSEFASLQELDLVKLNSYDLKWMALSKILRDIKGSGIDMVMSSVNNGLTIDFSQPISSAYLRTKGNTDDVIVKAFDKSDNVVDMDISASEVMIYGRDIVKLVLVKADGKIDELSFIPQL